MACASGLHNPKYRPRIAALIAGGWILVALVLAPFATPPARAAGEDVAIESSDLPPLDGEASPDAQPGDPQPGVSGETATPSSGGQRWLGLQLKEARRLEAEMPRPLGSAMLAALWRQLLKGGPESNAEVMAFRALSLLDQGWAADAASLLASLPTDDPAIALVAAKAALATGDGSQACPLLRRVPAAMAVKLDKTDRSDFVAMAAFCAALSKDETQTALAADVLRETGIDRPIALAVLDSLSTGTTPDLPTDRSLDLIDARLAGLVRPARRAELGDRPLPDAVAALTADPARDPESRAEAVELALAAHLLPASTLAEAYQAIELAPELLQNPLAQEAEGPLRRAVLYQAALEERAMLRKARYIRAMLDETSREGLGAGAAALLADAVEDLPQVGEIGWFAESAVEILVTAGRTADAQEWIRRDEDLDTTGGRLGLGHWLVLADIAQSGDVSRGALAELEPAIRAGVFPPDVLQRLVTVLDALEYNVPIPVWEAAGSGAQSDSGDLPETGLLSELQETARKGDRPRTVLLVVLTLAKGGPGGTHQLALGDTLRALKKIGMEREARQLAFEALYPVWPRRAGG